MHDYDSAVGYTSGHGSSENAGSLIQAQITLGEVKEPVPQHQKKENELNDGEDLSLDETDTCELSMQEHIVRRMIKENDDHIDRKVQSIWKREASNDDDTDTCPFSIDEHLTRRIPKWKHIQNMMIADDSTFETDTGENNNDQTTVGSHSGSLSDTSFSTSTDHSSARQLKMGSSGTRVRDPLAHKSEASHRLRRSPQQPRHCKTGNVDCIPTYTGISTVHPIDKHHANPAFAEPKRSKSASLPIEIKNLIPDDLSSIPGFLGDGTVVPPVDLNFRYAPSIAEAERGASVLSDSVEHKTLQTKPPSPREHTRWELFCVTLISLSLAVLVVLLVLVVVKG